MTVREHYAGPAAPLSTNLGSHFLCVRYNADLSGAGLKNLGFPQVDRASIQRVDAVENIPVLLKIGRAAAQHVDIHQHKTMKPAMRSERVWRSPAIRW
jgi:hypothetical protein